LDEDELEKIAAADELELASARRDGTLHRPITIWVVRYGASYVDPMIGPEASAATIKLVPR
jgi:hypothetical protein